MPVSMAMITLVMAHIPDAGSEWPMLDLTDPIRSGVFLPLQNTWSKAFSSSGSPTWIQFQKVSSSIKQSVPESVLFNQTISWQWRCQWWSYCTGILILCCVI